MKTVTLVLALLILGSHDLGAMGDGRRGNSFAWAGGMNAAQFCSIDLNRDGIRDILMFDRHGNRIIPLIYTGTFYKTDTSIISLLPADLHEWVMTADYNGDGKMDLFTYGLGSIRVFRNVSDSVLRFEWVTSMIKSWYYAGYVGILVTPVDYPAISDIDGDGDLDILTFFGLGSFVEYHQNMSVEKYGNRDSLDYRLNTNCWGKFKESEGSNKITLNADCPGEPVNQWTSEQVGQNNGSIPHPVLRIAHRGSQEKHTGSTLLTWDLTSNGLPDLILADVDYPNLVSLYNEGTPDTAFMASYDTLFPVGTIPVNLFDFPVASRIDVNHDGLDDLLISSFNPSLTIADNIHSCWYYQNRGTQEMPGFEFQQNNYFQDAMIDVGSNSYPLLADLNGDGLQDLLIGCWGRYDSSYYEETILKSVFKGGITYYENRGTSLNPLFVWITDDLANLSQHDLLGVYPAMADLDDDGYPDLLIGQADGTLAYLRNTGSGTNPPSFDLPVWGFDGIDVGNYSTPQLFDLDHDGFRDLIIGEQNGNINYYKHTGNPQQPAFQLITDSLGKINVTNYQQSYYGYSTPCFFTDAVGTDHLICGSEEGLLWFFDEIPEDPQASWIASDSLWKYITTEDFPIRLGWRTAVSVGYLSSQTHADLIAGNYCGGLNYFSRQSPPDVIPSIPKPLSEIRFGLRIFPNPATTHLTIDPPKPWSGKPLTFQILNLQGQCVLNGILPPNRTISLTSLEPGIYFIYLSNTSSAEATIPEKLIVLR